MSWLRLSRTPLTLLGLRPLLNLSQTCFLSSILQALIHNPLLKAYFLSDKHNRHVCTNGSRGLAVGRPFIGTETPGGSTPADREKGCMCCEMDRAFEEFHNDDTSPFGPVTMLYSMWHASAELEGYGQQGEPSLMGIQLTSDAHSFFLAALDHIHAHAKGQLSSCNCIARACYSPIRAHLTTQTKHSRVRSCPPLPARRVRQPRPRSTRPWISNSTSPTTRHPHLSRSAHYCAVSVPMNVLAATTARVTTAARAAVAAVLSLPESYPSRSSLPCCPSSSK